MADFTLGQVFATESAWWMPNDQVKTVVYTVILVFAAQGFLSMWRTPARSRPTAQQEHPSAPPDVDQPVDSVPKSGVDKTTILESPKSDAAPAVQSVPQATPPSTPADGAAGDGGPAPSATSTDSADPKQAPSTTAPDTSVPKGGQISTTATPKSLGPTTPATATPSKAASAPPITAQQLMTAMSTMHGDVKMSHVDLKGLIATVSELKASIGALHDLPARVASIEKILGTLAGKLGPMAANTDSTQKAVDVGFKENLKLLSTISSNVRGHREDAQQEAKEFHAEQGQWLTSTEAKLVDGIKEVLKKITNTDFNSSQVYNQKLEGIASEILAALNFTQGEVADLKQSLASTSEEVHSIKEMCERPVVAHSPPTYRAPTFHPHQDIPPAPHYDARQRVNLQQALPLGSTEGITVNPDGRSLNIPLR
ncbi:unnamed protein product [Symbiodinium sp. CCMP2592]|nr:unnamed protein product [Symbiodinium sp. CCMP2592]